MSYDAPLALIAQRAIPFIIAPTGTMGANGAITLGTALPTTYANAFVYLPANAIGTGIPAGWYFTQFSSATLGVVYNNTYVSGIPNIPGILAPFVTPSVGAYTGVTTQQNAAVVAVPGNAIGPNGALRFEATWTVPNNANNKTVGVGFGGSTYFSTVLTTVVFEALKKALYNRGVANAQVGDTGTGGVGTGTGAAAPVYGSTDTTLSQNLSFTSQIATATDYLILEAFSVQVTTS